MMLPDLLARQWAVQMQLSVFSSWGILSWGPCLWGNWLECGLVHELATETAWWVLLWEQMLGFESALPLASWLVLQMAQMLNNGSILLLVNMIPCDQCCLSSSVSCR